MLAAVLQLTKTLSLRLWSQVTWLVLLLMFFQTEPLPEGNRLWKTKNLLITPHVAGNMTLLYTKDKNVNMFLEDLENFTKGAQLHYLVDKNLGY